ncbi:hypothetical protein HU200_017163 [Digitaria exilis]|uniref:SHSP domain-containing protein n=1 Tax=Digitaria exilis TaxID=1010633 RepID=A0A835KK96_9POAL|nr:hypothetical protein HU200_017163 [Digitaria exilis]
MQPNSLKVRPSYYSGGMRLLRSSCNPKCRLLESRISNFRFRSLYTPSPSALRSATSQNAQQRSRSPLATLAVEFGVAASTEGSKQGRNSGRAMTELFDTAVTSLLHLPEVLDRLAAADGDRRSAAHNGAHHHHHHGHARVHGLGGVGGGAPVDIVETPGEYAFLIDVPGLSKSDIQELSDESSDMAAIWRVTLEEEDRVLVMKGGNNNGKRKRDEEEGEGCRYIRLERRAAPRSFVRKFRLPEDADTGGIAARCENGVLTVTVKKKPPPEKKTKSVQVTIA